jgi:hypothetical protein
MRGATATAFDMGGHIDGHGFSLSGAGVSARGPIRTS